VGEDAAGELVGHLVERCRAEVVGGDEREDSRSGVGGAVHVANVNFIERGFANTEHERTFLFEANIGGALDQVRGNAVGNAGKRAHAARQDNHRVGGIGTAGDVGSDVGIRVLLNFAGGAASENLADEIAAAGDF